MIPLLFALLSPLFWGVMNVLDKFVISHRVKNLWSFGVLAGFVNIIYAVTLSLFLSWSGYSFLDYFYPAITGIIFGIEFFLYYYLLKMHDVSRIVGFAYVYPVVVAILSFLFLGELLSFISYVGMFLILAGVISLAYKKNMKFSKQSLWIIAIILIIGIYEFMVKVSTSNLPELNGIALNQIFLGLTISTILFSKSVRTNVVRDFRVIKWAFLTETFTFFGILTLFYAMAGLPATIVSSIAAIQPMVVVFLEYFGCKIGLKTCDLNFKKKFVSIALIVIGVIVLYLPELL